MSDLRKAEDYERSIREKVHASGCLSEGEWVYLIGLFHIEREAADEIGSLRASLKQAVEHSAKGWTEAANFRAMIASSQDRHLKHVGETTADLERLQAQLASARKALEEAASLVSAHIEEYHDFDYEPHQVPTELASLHAIDHHLQGSMMELDGVFDAVGTALTDEKDKS